MRPLLLAFALSLSLVLASRSGLASPGLPITGRVLDEQEQPLAGAEVLLLRVESPYERGRRLLEGGPELPPVARAVADAAGSYSIEAPGVGLWQVRVGAAGHLSVEMSVDPVYRPERVESARLPKRQSLKVSVVRPGGEALAPGELAGLRLASRSFSGWLYVPQTLRFDERGQPALDRLPRGHDLEVAAFLPGLGELGYLPGSELRNLPPLDPGRFVVLPTVKRVVRILDGQGRPVAAALLRQGQLPCVADGAGRWFTIVARTNAIQWPVGMTDADGRVSVAVPTGCQLSVPLSALTADGRSGVLEVKALAPEDETPLVIRLVDPTRITGRVLESVTRKPLVGAVVHLLHDEEAWTTSGADGAYSVLAVTQAQAPQWTVYAHLDGYFPLWESVYPRRRGGPGPRDLALKRELRLRGRVVDPASAPIAGAQLYLDSGRVRESLAGLPGEHSGGTTEPDGSFSVSLLPSLSYRLTVAKRGYAGRSLDVVAGGGPLELVLDFGRTGFGRVTDQAGAPIPWAEVRFSPIEDATKVDHVVPEGEENDTATTDETGRFAMPHLRARHYDLTVTAKGYAPAQRLKAAVPAGEGETDLGTFVLVSLLH